MALGERDWRCPARMVPRLNPEHLHLITFYAVFQIVSHNTNSFMIGNICAF